MNTCPICNNRADLSLIHRSNVPLLQNRVWADAVSARCAPSGLLNIQLCTECHFVWNSEFDPNRNIYDQYYDNDQSQSEYFRGHVSAMLEHVARDILGKTDVRLVEVGCGQGDFLNGLAQRADANIMTATGFDPAWRGGPLEGKAQIERAYFNRASTPFMHTRADVVVSRHTIEHVADPLDFLINIRDCMSDNPSSRLFLETPDVDWIIRNLQVQDMFYEHCSLFSSFSLRLALERAGFEALQIQPVFGGQYLWAEAAPSDHPKTLSFTNSQPISFAQKFSEYAFAFPNDWRKKILKLKVSGGVWLWGAASKGVTFSLLTDPKGELLRGAIDINMNKVGKFMPVSGLPIVGPEDLPNDCAVIIMNPNYSQEIRELISATSTGVQILELF